MVLLILYLLTQEQRLCFHLVILLTFFRRGSALFPQGFCTILIKSISSNLYSTHIHYIFYLVIVCTCMRCFSKRKEDRNSRKEGEIEANLVNIISFF